VDYTRTNTNYSGISQENETQKSLELSLRRGFMDLAIPVTTSKSVRK